jgi:uncharacterized small protein (DUF1192 family)
MARQTWMGLGVAALGMALVLGAEQGAAQTTAQDDGTQSQAEAEAQQRLDVARLRTQVAQLQQQLARTRAQLAQAESNAPAQQGVGGSGTAGTDATGGGTGETSAVGDPNAEAPEGATGIGYPTGTAPEDDDSGFALANVLHTGRVRSVSGQQIVLAQEGGVSTTLPLANDVQVLRGRQRVSLQSLEEGTRVRTSANLSAPGNPVSRIEILPSR